MINRPAIFGRFTNNFCSTLCSCRNRVPAGMTIWFPSRMLAINCKQFFRSTRHCLAILASLSHAGRHGNGLSPCVRLRWSGGLAGWAVGDQGSLTPLETMSGVCVLYFKRVVRWTRHFPSLLTISRATFRDMPEAQARPFRAGIENHCHLPPLELSCIFRIFL